MPRYLFPTLAVTAWLGAPPTALPAQEPSEAAPAEVATAAPITVSSNAQPGEFLAARAPLTLTLSRTPTTDEGRLAILVGSADLTALFAADEERLVYRGPVALPSGEQEVAVYVVRGDAWTEVGRFPIRVLTGRGFAEASLLPSLTISTSGLVAERRPDGSSGGERPPFEDFQLSGGVRTSLKRPGWTYESHADLVGSTDRTQALRFAERGESAPPVDLADYRMTVKRGRGSLAVGNVSAGSNRHLASGFGSRGLLLSGERGPLSLSVATLGGSPVVGWDDLLGVRRSDHRVTIGTLGVELLPSRPGALRLDLSVIDGSLRPRSGFTQGAVTDAERSRGFGGALVAATPGQRVRVSAGLARSRFENRRDALLEGDAEATPIEAVTRWARFAEANVVLAQNATLSERLTTTLAVGWRREHVDPQYRSIAAFARADVLSDAFDVTGSLGPLTIQGTHSRAHDNLGRVAAILRSQSRATSANFGLPLAGLVRQQSVLWPTLTASFSWSRERGTEVTGGGFEGEELPDQRATARELGAQWQGSRWRTGLRHGESKQDDRRSSADGLELHATTTAATLGFTPGSSVDLGLDLTFDQQRRPAAAQRSRLTRIGLSTTWRPRATTSIGANTTLARSLDRPETSRDDNLDFRLELSQAMEIGRGERRPRFQLFARFARQSAVSRRFDALADAFDRDRRDEWTLTSGLNLAFQ